MKIFKQEYKKSITEEWYQNGGREAIAEKVRQYRGRGIGSMYVSNLGLCSKGTGEVPCTQIRKMRFS